jgi:hypothetical protein
MHARINFITLGFEISIPFLSLNEILHLFSVNFLNKASQLKFCGELTFLFHHTIKTVSASIILFRSQYIHSISRHVSVLINHFQVNHFLKHY